MATIFTITDDPCEYDLIETSANSDMSASTTVPIDDYSVLVDSPQQKTIYFRKGSRVSYESSAIITWRITVCGVGMEQISVVDPSYVEKYRLSRTASKTSETIPKATFQSWIAVDYSSMSSSFTSNSECGIVEYKLVRKDSTGQAYVPLDNAKVYWLLPNGNV
jgi:hypothetical protein